ncbi:MAG: hypothetical protein WC408_05860 [Candidatus Micrarchaeia archaeon]
MVPPYPPIDFQAMLVAFGSVYAYFQLKVGQKLLNNKLLFARAAFCCALVFVVLASTWELAANLVIGILLIAALREF